MASSFQTCSVSCDSYLTNMPTRLYEQLVKGAFSDCVIVAEGKFVRAHRLILSISSEYFEVSVKSTIYHLDYHHIPFTECLQHCRGREADNCDATKCSFH